MTADTHGNTRKIRLPIYAHCELTLLAWEHRLTASTMLDLIVEWWAGAHHRGDVAEVTGSLPTPNRRLPTEGERPQIETLGLPATRQLRIHVRTYARIRLLARERHIFMATQVEDLLEAYMAAKGINYTDHLQGVPRRSQRTFPRGEIEGPIDAVGDLITPTGEIHGAIDSTEVVVASGEMS